MIVDRAVVERLESTAATAATALCRALAALAPGSGAVVEPLGDGALVAMGAGRYVNRAVGVSLADLLADELVERVVAFYRRRDLAPAIELCSWAPAGLLEQLGDRGFRPAWFRDVFVRSAGPATDLDGPPPAGWSLHEVGADGSASIEGWQRVLADGNRIDDPAARAVSDEFVRAAHSMPGSTDYLATIDGEPAGCGSLHRVAGVGWVGAAATVPRFGQRGVQGALLRHRVAVAAADGCDVVAASALPDGRSARNLRRHGFVPTHTQLVMVLDG